MPFDGSGNFSLVAGNPVVTGATISSTTHNNTNNDLATGLTNCLTRDGQSPPTANIPMGSNKLTGLAAGTGNGESVRYEQVALLAGATFTGAVVVPSPTAATQVAQVQQLSDAPIGLTMSTAGSSDTMTIGAGAALDSTRALALTLAASIAKTTSAWSVGTAAGGLDTGTIANSTWYHFYLIRRPDTGVVDVVFSTSATSPTLPTDYTQYRYIGSGITDGSAQWRKFIQKGDEFWWDAPSALDINTSTLSTSNVSFTLPTPLGVSVKAIINGYALNAVATNSVKIFSPLIADTNAASGGNFTSIIASNGAYTPFLTNTWTNTSSQVTAVATAASTTLVASVQGYHNLRGRNA